MDLAPATAAEAAAPLERLLVPTLSGFAALLVDRLPGNIQLVRKAPAMPGANGEGILVVVSGAPADLRSQVENALAEHYVGSAPQLHLMDSEGYRALSAFIPALAQSPAPEEVAYHAVSLPTAPASDAFESRRKRASEGLAFAEKRLALAELLLKGNFPEEMSRPLRKSLGWTLTSLLALHSDRYPSADLPSPRLIHAELVERGHLPVELSQKLAQVRELTEQPEVGEEAVPLSQQAGQTLFESVRELINLAQEQIIKAGI